MRPEYTLYLSKEGDEVEIKNYLATSPLAEQTEAAACKTHAQVLEFLNKLKLSDIKNKISFYHYNNTCYQHHIGTDAKANAHKCELEKLISFVTYKILECQHGLRQTPKKGLETLFG